MDFNRILKCYARNGGDRGFHVGDIIRYTCIDSPIVDEKISEKLYYITYITNFEQKDGYVVFGDREVKE